MDKNKPETSATDFFPKRKSLKAFRAAAADCKGCDLRGRGTQTVFGEWARRAEVLFIGEQPGNEEDLTGKPFVGPAGRLLDDALIEAGIDRTSAYVTNVVKHFKWEPRGKRRIHAKPDTLEIMSCRPWLEAEIAVVKPRLVVCLGATAAQTLLGRKFKVTQQRGELHSSPLAPRRRDVEAGPGVLARAVRPPGDDAHEIRPVDGGVALPPRPAAHHLRVDLVHAPVDALHEPRHARKPRVGRCGALRDAVTLA